MKKGDLFNLSAEEFNNDIVVDSIESVIEDSMIEYGSYIIEDRAIPSVLDGLKPVQRRSLYTFKNDDLIGPKSVKLAKVVGSVMGNLHPHGDSSIVGTFVNMSQPFKNNFMVLKPQGNWGSIENPDSFAAMRYIETAMPRKFADLFFKDIDKKGVVSWKENYDGSIMEPQVLPVKYPFHLINGSSGIAYSMATKIPSFNIVELTNLFIQLIEDKFWEKGWSLNEERKNCYSSIVKGPDFATGPDIYFSLSENEAEDILFEDTFSFRMRAKYTIDEENQRIVFSNIPYEVATDKVVEDLISLKMAYTLDGKKQVMKDPQEVLQMSSAPIVEQNGSKVALTIQLKKDCDPYVELAKILKRTTLDKSFKSTNNVISSNGVPITMSIFDNITTFLKFRQHVVYKSIQDDIVQLNKKLPLLIAFEKAISKKKEFLEIIQESKDDSSMREEIIQLLDINEEQLNYVLEIKIKKLSKEEALKALEEVDKVRNSLTEKEEQISSQQNVFDIVKEDYLSLLSEKFIKENVRNSEVVKNIMSLNKEDLISDKNIIISLMEDNTIGWVENTIKTKGRGTATSNSTANKKVSVLETINCNLKDSLVFITNFGRAFQAKAYDFQQRFSNISNVLNLSEDEKVIKIIKIDTDTLEDKEAIFITKKGVGSRSRLRFLTNSSKNRAVWAFRIAEGDELVSFNIVKPKDELVLLTNTGLALRFKVTDIRYTKSAGKGVKAYSCSDNEFVKSSLIIPSVDNIEEANLIIAFENGEIKKTPLTSLKVKKRNQKGLLMGRNEVTSIADGNIVFENENIMLSTKFGRSSIIKVSDIKAVSRTAIGLRKGINLEEGDVATKLSTVLIEEEVDTIEVACTSCNFETNIEKTSFEDTKIIDCPSCGKVEFFIKEQIENIENIENEED